MFWKGVSRLFFESRLFHAYPVKRFLLRSFGAKVGKGVLIKPNVRITFPWKLSLGDYCWIGEEVWIDNLVQVMIGPHACISQRAYLCTGNHNYHKPTFDLQNSPIRIEEGAWISAGSIVGPGVTVGKNAMLALGSVTSQNLDPFGIYRGNPAQKIGVRSFSS
jgi:putative colanic acid biosynthesis acetyltransferase WcaF